MPGINYLAVIVAAVAAFVTSTVWYIVFGKERMKLLGLKEAVERPGPLKILSEIVRNLVLGSVLAYFIVHLGVTGWMGAVQFGLLVWIGFPAILLSGSVMWDRVPVKLAAIHAGDWLVKLLLIAVILGMWR